MSQYLQTVRYLSQKLAWLRRHTENRGKGSWRGKMEKTVDTGVGGLFTVMYISWKFRTVNHFLLTVSFIMIGLC